MAPQRDSQKDENEIIELAMSSPTTTNASCLRLQIEGDNKSSRRVTFAPGTKEMSMSMSSMSTPTKRQSNNTWNPANGWKIDPSVKLSFDVVDLYRGPRLGELATYANSYYQQKRRTPINQFQTDGMNTNVVDTCPLKRTQGSPRIQSEKLSDFEAASSTNDIDTCLLKRTQGNPRIQSEKLSDSEAASSSSSSLKHRRTCRSDLPTTDEIVLLNHTTTTAGVENQAPECPNRSQHNASLLTMITDIRKPDNRSYFDQTLRHETHSPSTIIAPQAMETKCLVTNELIVPNWIPPQKNGIIDDQAYLFANSSLMFREGSITTITRRQRQTVLAFRCFQCFFCAFLFSLCFYC